MVHDFRKALYRVRVQIKTYLIHERCKFSRLFGRARRRRSKFVIANYWYDDLENTPLEFIRRLVKYLPVYLIIIR